MKPSIRANLLKWMIAPLLLINLVGAGLTFWLAWAPTQTALDHSLADAAWALIPRLRETGGVVTVDLPHQAEQVLRVDHFDSIFFVIRDATGRTLAGDHDFPALAPLAHVDEPNVHEGSMRGEPVRIVNLKASIGTATVYIGAAETKRKREESLRRIVATLVLIEIALTCVAVTVVWTAVRRGLLPLKKMQDDLNRRQDIDLAPLAAADAPIELAPLIEALNGLLDRTQAGATAQQTFLANIAHQLRTPLAGLKIHLEWQQQHATDGALVQATTLMMASTDRMIRQTNQLLALARAEPSHLGSAQREPLWLDALVAESVQHFVREADLRQIDLGFDLRPAQLHGDRFLLRDMVDNLIDNAIRYSPVRGRVTVRCWQDSQGCTLVVEDNGPGIAPDQRALVFNRFYRLDHGTPGSGLGLAIVHDIVAAHGAQVTLHAGPDGSGTSFAVAFPAQPTDTGGLAGLALAAT